MIGKSFQVDQLSLLLQQAELRHRVISQNIANVNTPGYRNVDVSFAGTLEQMMDHSRGSLQASLVETPGLAVRQDGNNVDVDGELGKLTKNSLQFETYSQLLAAKMAMLRSAISGQ